MSPLGRLVEIAEEGRHLGKDRGFLTVSARGKELGRVPLDDLGGVIATGHGTTLSLNLATALAERGVALVLCGRNFVPSALLWPVTGHHAQQRRMEAQIAQSTVLAKRLWAQLVAAKVRRQGWVLAQVGEQAGAFGRLARMVKAGDPENIEAQASRRYWPLLLGRAFRRDSDGDWPNAALNYGYTVLRAGTARAICGTGLHPSLGIFHRHPHNAMALADDLMEPFRPVVDLLVRHALDDGESRVTPDVKKRLAGVLGYDLITAAGTTPLGTCVQRLAQSLASCYLDGGTVLDLPHVAAPAEASTVSGESGDADEPPL
jgi:CRISPR-associated protein Cas1